MSAASPFIPPSDGIPGAPSPAGDSRTSTIGLVALILGILDILWTANGLVSAAASKTLLQFQRSFLSAMPTSGGPSLTAMMQPAERFTSRIMGWQCLRLSLFLPVTIWLVVIAVRLLRGRAEALETAKRWTWFAFGAIAVSTALQGFAILPAQLEYQREMSQTMPPMPAPASTMMEAMEVFSSATMIFSLMIAAAVLAIWPVALRLWADRVQKQIGAGAPVNPAP